MKTLVLNTSVWNFSPCYFFRYYCPSLKETSHKKINENNKCWDKSTFLLRKKRIFWFFDDQFHQNSLWMRRKINGILSFFQRFLHDDKLRSLIKCKYKRRSASETIRVKLRRWFCFHDQKREKQVSEIKVIKGKTVDMGVWPRIVVIMWLAAITFLILKIVAKRAILINGICAVLQSISNNILLLFIKKVFKIITAKTDAWWVWLDCD